MNDSPVLSISQLTALIQEILEGSFPQVTVEGEISNCRPSSTGHLYFTLKDEGAAISAVMFKGRSRYLTFTPRDGMRVQVSGAISVYAQRGTYQIIAETISQAGAGDILRMLEERKQRLAAEGLFDSSRKRPIPFFPETVGVITSPTGAALRDVLQIVGRRNPKISVVILPAPVQGDEAASVIRKQIETANRYNMADVLIVGRGGGSLEDLLPFSDEAVVRAVAASEIPIVSAVGHEIDWSLSDYAADVRAPTPSAAAELVSPLLCDIEENIEECRSDMVDTMERYVERLRLMVRSFSAESMELRFRRAAQPVMLRFDDAKEALFSHVFDKIRTIRNRVALMERTLEGANPSAILARGYSVVRDAISGAVIRSAADTSEGALLSIVPSSGRITAQVKSLDIEK